MAKQALILLMLIITASAQMPPRTIADLQLLATKPPLSAGPNHNLITNIAGYPIYGWYPAEGNYLDTGTLTNLASWNANLELTNPASPPSVVANGLNGLDYLKFDGSDDVLRNDPASDADGFFEYAAVVSYTNAGAVRYIISSLANNDNGVVTYTSSGELRLAATSAITNGVCTNIWFTLQGVFAGTQAALYSNGVCVATGEITATAIAFLTVGARRNLLSYTPMTLAELCVWTTNIGAINSVGEHCTGARSNVAYYLGNKYGLAY